MFNKNIFTQQDALADPIKKVMEESEKRRMAETIVNAEYGVGGRKGIPHEKLNEYEQKVQNVLKESTETINELSKKTLSSYAKKAQNDATYALGAKGIHGKARDKELLKKFDKRIKGRDLAKAKINPNVRVAATEETNLDEGVTRKHFQQVADIIKAHPDQEKRNELAKHHAEIFAKQNPRFDHKRFHAAAGSTHVNEETLDELSLKTKSSYVKKAAKEYKTLTKRQDSYDDHGTDFSDDEDRKKFNRGKGLVRAGAADLRSKIRGYKGPERKRFNEEKVNEISYEQIKRMSKKELADYQDRIDDINQKSRDSYKVSHDLVKKLPKKDNIQELSKNTLGNYIKKSSFDAQVSAHQIGTSNGEASGAKKLRKRRSQGIEKATDRLTGSMNLKHRGQVKKVYYGAK